MYVPINYNKKFGLWQSLIKSKKMLTFLKDMCYNFSNEKRRGFLV